MQRCFGILELSSRLLFQQQRIGPYLLQKTLEFQFQQPQFQSIRLRHNTGHRLHRRRRKPWWLPIAKTKVFTLPRIKEYPEVEGAELMRLENNYATYKRSIRMFMQARYETNEALTKIHDQETTEDAEIERITALIEKDNAKVREIREKALVEEWKNMEHNILETRSKLEEEAKLKLKETEERLDSELARLKTAIPPEGIDEAIEKALATEVDYNFSIDKKGNKYHGRLTRPPPTQPQLQEPPRQLAARVSS